MKKFAIIYTIFMVLTLILKWTGVLELSFWGIIFAPVWQTVAALIIGSLTLRWPLVSIVVLYAVELICQISVHWLLSLLVIPAVTIGASIVITKIILEWLWLTTNNERHTTCAARFFYKKFTNLISFLQ